MHRFGWSDQATMSAVAGSTASRVLKEHVSASSTAEMGLALRVALVFASHDSTAPCLSAAPT